MLISDLVPRFFHRVARARLVKQIGPNIQPMQLRGLRHMLVNFVTFLLNALRQQAWQSKQSHAVIFLDIAAAFYRAQRSTVDDSLNLGIHAGDEDVAVAEMQAQPALLVELQNMNFCSSFEHVKLQRRLLL